MPNGQKTPKYKTEALSNKFSEDFKNGPHKKQILKKKTYAQIYIIFLEKENTFPKSIELHFVSEPIRFNSLTFLENVTLLKPERIIYLKFVFRILTTLYNTSKTITT